MEYRFSLRAARAYAGLSLHEASEKLGVSYPTLQGWESGRVEPKPSKIEEMATLYGVEAKDIFLQQKTT